MTTVTTMYFTIGICSLIAILFLYFLGKPTVKNVATAPSILTGIGIFGTFLGITIGLMHFDPSDIVASVPIFLGGIKLAFWSSVVGIFASLIHKIKFSIWPLQEEHPADEMELSTVESLKEMTQSLSSIETLMADNANQNLNMNELGDFLHTFGEKLEAGLLTDGRDQALLSVDTIKADEAVLVALRELKEEMSRTSQDEQNIVKSQMQRLLDELKEDALAGGERSEGLLEVFSGLKDQIESNSQLSRDASKEQLEALFSGLTRAAAGTLGELSDIADNLISQAKWQAGNLAEEISNANEVSAKSMIGMLKEILAATEDANLKITTELAKLRGDVAADLKATTEQSSALIEQLHAMTESYKASLISTTTDLKAQISKDMKASYNLIDTYTKAVADVTGTNQVESLERMEGIANIMQNVVQSSSDMAGLLHDNAAAMSRMQETFTGTNEGSLGRFLLNMNENLIEHIVNLQNSLDATGSLGTLMQDMNSESLTRLRGLEKAFEGSVYEMKQLPREFVKGMNKLSME